VSQKLGQNKSNHNASAESIPRFFFPKPEPGSLTAKHASLYAASEKFRHHQERSNIQEEEIEELVSLFHTHAMETVCALGEKSDSSAELSSTGRISLEGFDAVWPHLCLTDAATADSMPCPSACAM
jgi:hypothetical protein